MMSLNMQRHITVGGGDVASVTFSNDLPFVIMAGPCAMESKDHAMEIAGFLAETAKELGIGFVYKTSFDKANRTSLTGKRGVGIEKGLHILADVRKEIGCPIVTDVHLPEQCKEVAEVVDILQIPAFLCRQTDMLLAAGETGKAINIKKGQFLAPWDMVNVVKKIESTGNEDILLCERGVSFGYNTLVSDMRSIPVMRQTGCPVVFDAGHSVQQPGGAGTASGGQRQFIPTLARAALAVGVAAVFMETHQDPDNAPSDGPNMVYLDQMPALLKIMKAFDDVAKEHPEVIEV
jgi:2-dehydro-3-deoxyphosphooctonate aldolase (KDO 8-P synthase)